MSAAVADLVLVEEFLNTLDARTFSRHGQEHAARDALTTAEALAAWLAAHGLGGAEQDVRAADLAAARALRAGLRQALSSTDGTGPAEALAGFPLRLATDPAGHLCLVGASGAAGLDVLVETVAVGVATGRWSRLKLCASPDCRWAFYDTSRSGGGRWCSMEVCGNRHKTRAYRQRRGD